jgi:molecular chaperone DnaK (HSP70)
VLRTVIDDITRLAMENRMQEANALLEKLKEETGKLGQTDPADEEIRHAQGICNWTRVALNKYGAVIPPKENQKILEMVSELETAIEKGDKKKISQLDAELDKITNQYSVIVLLMNSISLSSVLQQYPNDQKLLDTKRDEVESAIAQNNQQKFDAAVKELQELYIKLKIKLDRENKEMKITDKSGGVQLAHLSLDHVKERK